MSGRGLWVLGVAVMACSRAAPDAMPDAVTQSDAAAAPVGVPRLDVAADASSRGVALAKAAMPITSAQSVPAPERMIVRTAEMSLQVSDVHRVTQQITDATAAAHGFLGTSRMWRDGESDRATMVVRVPATALDATLTTLRAMAVRVDNESVTGEDVTRQAVDLSAQLTNLRATEVELRALLTTVREKTKRAADVLEVHAELSRVRGEIEQHTAELQQLTQMAALSTITLDLRPDAVAQPIATDAWQPRGVLRDAVRALAGTGRVAVNAVIWAVVYIAPLLALAGGLLFALRRLWRRAVGASTRAASVG